MTRPILGGRLIMGRSGRDGYQGTIGLAVKSPGDTRLLITAGHVVGAETARVYDATPDQKPGVQIGTVFANYAYSRDGGDFALVGLLDSVRNQNIEPWTVGFVGPDGRSTMRRQITSIARSRPRQGAQVMFVGARTGVHVGIVSGVRETFSFTDEHGKRQRLTDVMILKVKKDDPIPVKQGDSGGPVFYGDDFLGIMTHGTDIPDKDGYKIVVCTPIEQFADYISTDISHRWR